MTVLVEPDTAYGAGHALIRLPGAAAAAGAPGFRIQREDYDDGQLGPLGWQSSDVLLQPDRAEADGPDLLLHVGWAVCRHLEAGMYTLLLPASGLGGESMSWPDIVPLHAGALDVMTPPIAAKPDAPEATSQAAVPAPAPALTPAVTPAGHAEDGLQSPPPPTRIEPPAPRSRMPLYGLLVLLLLIAAGGAAWWKYRQPPAVSEAQVQPAPTPEPTPPAPPTPPPEPTPPPVPPVPPAPVQLSSLSVPDVLSRAPNPAAITAEGTRRLQADRHDDGLLLLEAAADRGDGGAAAALAKLYDPVLFQPGGPIPKADARQAARYYRDAARAGVDVAAPREALRHNLETRVQSGDLGANLSLKDFWP